MTSKPYSVPAFCNSKKRPDDQRQSGNHPHGEKLHAKTLNQQVADEILCCQRGKTTIKT